MEWNQEALNLLEELVKPIPVFARPMAKKKIEGVILSVVEGETVTKDDVVKGYLLASSGDMKDRAVKLLKAKGIDVTPYEVMDKQT